MNAQPGSRRSHRRPAASPRPAHTLVEMVIVITFFSLLLILATRLIVLMYDRERTARDQVASATVLDRLAHQFQRDVRAADKILRIGRGQPVSNDIPPERSPGRAAAAVILRLQVGETVVEYAETATGVTRQVLRADAREDYELFRLPALVGHGLPESGRVDISMQQAGGRRSLLTFALRDVPPRIAKPEEDHHRQIQQTVSRLSIQAMLGADLRFAGERAKEEK